MYITEIRYQMASYDVAISFFSTLLTLKIIIYPLTKIPTTKKKVNFFFFFNAAQLAAIQTSHGKHVKIHTQHLGNKMYIETLFIL